MQGNRTNHPIVKTSFKKGHIRSAESIDKQRCTMLRQFNEGKRFPPKPNWNKKSIEKMVESNRKSKLKHWPIGSKRLHNTGHGIYYVIKTSDSGKWHFEHRFIMEQFIGRKLKKTEIVHHKNNNKLDNSLKNLQIVTPSEHYKIHFNKN